MNPGDVLAVKLNGLILGGKTRFRVLELWGYPVNRKTAVKRTDAAVPYPLLYLDGSGHDPRSPHTDSGHLMSLGLGGPTISVNVVSMYSGFNRWGQWKTVESDIVKLVPQHQGLILRVGIDYNGTDKRIPSAFHVEGITGGTPDTKKITGGTVVYSKTGIPHSCPMPEFYILSEQDYKLVLEALKQMEAAKWTMEAWASSQNPSGNALNLPGEGVARPYAVLDYMVAFNLLPGDTIINGQTFSSNQRNNILTVNRILYGQGWIKSEVADDPHQTLSTDGGDFGAEVDHIVPRKGQGGCNAYSNAQVVSWRKNKSKGMS
jgi:hypothetical protein